jgi:DNA-binding winged helix-turn-helix (wHTH) protein
MQFHFGEYALDIERCELRRQSTLVPVEPQVFDLLVYLVRNRDRVVSKDDLIADVWGGRIVSESTLSSRINAARKAVGDSGGQQGLIRTIARKGIRFIGAVDEQATASPKPAAPSDRGTAAAILGSLRQEIHFCTASDGVSIAYAAVGDGPPLVKAANWLNHLEYDWQSPIWSHLLREIAAEYRLISRAWSRPPGSTGSRCLASPRAARLPSLTRSVIPSA